MKRYIQTLGLILFVLILVIACPRVSRTYEFPNSMEDIVSIDLLINTDDVGKADVDKLIVQKSLSEEEISSFMSEIYMLETRRCYPPMWGWGEYIAKVTYDNGDIELLGSDNIEYVKKGSSATGDGPYAFWGYGLYEEVFIHFLG